MDEVIKRVEAFVAKFGGASGSASLSIADLRELLLLARSNRDALADAFREGYAMGDPDTNSVQFDRALREFLDRIKDQSQ